MENTIYHIENRGSEYIGHFMIYMIGGLRHIINNTLVDTYSGNGHGNLYEHNVKNRNPTNDYPINIYIQNYDNKNTLNNEILYELRHKFNIISDITPYLNDESYQILNSYGEPNEPNTHPDSYVFVRDLFLTMSYTYNPMKYIYITRKNSHLLNGNKNDNNIKRRQIINEEELFKELSTLNFEFVQLEKYSFVEKIKLFNTSAIILSPQSGALTCSLFANKKTKIIEICPKNPTQYCDQYKEMCNALQIKWERYSDITHKDKHDNMKINIKPLLNILHKYNAEIK